VGEDEPKRVIHGAGGNLVGRRQQRGDRETGGVGAGALVAAQPLRIRLAQVPYEKALGGYRFTLFRALIDLVKLVLVTLDDQQVAVALTVGVAGRVARQVRRSLEVGVGRHGHAGRNALAVGSAEAVLLGADDLHARRAFVGVEDGDREVDLERIAVAPSTHA